MKISKSSLLAALASSQREIVGLGAKGIVGAMLAIAPERSACLVDDAALGTWIANVALRNPGMTGVPILKIQLQQKGQARPYPTRVLPPHFPPPRLLLLIEEGPCHEAALLLPLLHRNGFDSRDIGAF